jgi:hypothetical protein
MITTGIMVAFVFGLGVPEAPAINWDASSGTGYEAWKGFEDNSMV